MTLPRPRWHGGPAVATWRDLAPGDRLVRIFDTSGKYDPASFNPNWVVPNLATKRGRFSSTRKDKYSYIYVADHLDDGDERVAIAEMIDHEDLAPRSDGVKALIGRTLVKDLAFCYMEVTSAIRVVKLTTEAQARDFGASQEALRSQNYWLTREWARYVRARIDTAGGIEYVSVRYLDSDAGYAMVLFGDRLPPRCIKQVGDAVPLVSPEGRKILMDCKDYTGFVPSW